MTNKEKYPNTDEAIKAFAEHEKRCNCGCSFEEWLNMPTSPLGFGVSIITDLIAMSLLNNISKDRNGKSSKDTVGSHVAGVECPICHGKNAKIRDGIEPTFTCPDCDVAMSKSGINLGMSVPKFESFIADLCKKNGKKD